MFYKKILSTLMIFLISLLLCITPFNVSATTNVEETIPSSYSSKDLGYCSSIKSQTTGICWAYATLASYESFLLRNNLYTTDYDPFKLDKWATPDANGNGWVRNEGKGAYTYVPMGYLVSWEGPTTADGVKTNVGVTGIEYMGSLLSPVSSEHIKESIMKNGAVTATMNAASYATSDKVHYNAQSGLGSIATHAISVIGWDDNYSKENFINSPKKDGAWLCKNSWGNYNSLEGYFWISYCDNYLFNIPDEAFCITNCQKIDENTYLHQNEKYGANKEFNYIKQKNISFINVFDFTDKGNRLDKVVFETTSKNADYTIWYVPLNNNIPISDKTQWKELGSGKVDYRGYICADVEDLLLPKEKAGIAVTIDTTNSGNYANIGVSEARKLVSTEIYTFKDSSNYGESFIFYNNTMQDLKEYYEQQRKDNVGCHVVIKAITTGNYTPNVKCDYNLDGKITINDATAVQLHIAKLKPFTNNQINNACKEGKLTINDATLIQLALVGKINL